MDGDRLYGYYAKSGIRNLIFWAQIHKDLDDAVKDHIVLVKIKERICEEAATCEDFPAAARAAVAAVLAEEGLEESFLRSVSVTFSAYHWVGRELSVHTRNLPTALAAWQALESARGPPLFRGRTITAAYTPERVAEQWRHVRGTYLQLHAALGGVNRARAEELRLVALEAEYRPVFQRKSALYWRQWKKVTEAPAGGQRPADTDSLLLRRAESALRRWRREAARQEVRAKRASARDVRACAELAKKRRWDGKESFAAFERRVLGKKT